MTTKTPMGIPVFDRCCGGVYAGRCLLLTGRSGAGKTVGGLQFLKQGLERGERGLMLTGYPAQDLALYAEGLGLDVDQAVTSNDLILLEYSDYVPGRDRETDIMIPPEGFSQLIATIRDNLVQRVVLDTAIPWITFASCDRLPEHIFSLVRAFERLNVTTLMTCSKPVSPLAKRAHEILVGNVPVALCIDYDPGSEMRKLLVEKYIGLAQPPPVTPVQIAPGKGLVPCLLAVSSSPAPNQQSVVPFAPAFTHAGVWSMPFTAAAPAPVSAASMQAAALQSQPPEQQVAQPPPRFEEVIMAEAHAETPPCSFANVVFQIMRI